MMENALTSIDFNEYLKRKKAEKKIFAHFCSYTPEELIHAAGILPVRIFGTQTVEKANSHLQSYCCSYARKTLEEALNNQYDGFVFVHSCDTLQRLADITRCIPSEFHDCVGLPTSLSTESQYSYLVHEVTRFKTRLEEYAGPLSEENISKSIHIYNKNRKLLSQIYSLRKKGDIPAIIIDKIMKSSMIMEKEEHTEALAAFLETVEVQEAVHPRFLISGSVILNPQIFPVIESYGSVAYDDLCTGSRYLTPIEEPTMEGLIQRYHSLWCPCRYMNQNRVEYLEKKCKEYEIDGIIFALQKFCEPHFFEVVHMKKELKERGIPSLLLELQDQPLEQVRTRIQAFSEIVEGGMI